MKRTISAAGKPIFFIKKLTKQFIQRNLPCCKNTQVPVHGEKVVGGTDSQCRSNRDRKSTRLNSSHVAISYAVFCLKKKKRCQWMRIKMWCLIVNMVCSMKAISCQQYKKIQGI